MVPDPPRTAACAALAGLLLALSATPVGQPAAPPAPAPSPGYHHLGASTAAGRWSGVLGRMRVTAPGVRAGSYDFVASRFMVKGSAPGDTRWLEAGWARTGWTGGGRQRIYTYDTNTNRWTFYDQYPIGPGDRIWIELLAGPAAGTGPAAPTDWAAWVWWHAAWHLLTTQRLAIGAAATVEQYVEVYVDPKRGGSVPVPPVQVDNVQVRAAPGSPMRYWTAVGVPTDPGTATAPYCLSWQVTYNTWTAGSCP